MARASWWCMLAALVATASAQQNFTIEDFLSGQFSQRGFGGIWISDHEFTYTIAGEPGIYVFDANTLTGSVLVSGQLMELLNTNNPILSADRQYILASSEVESVYRYSTTAKYSRYEIATNTITNIANHQRLQLCIFGGGHSVAYVLDNNVYYLPENRQEAIQITNDGIPGVYYNGHADWVYEEDVMYTGQATWFSTEGSYLAFATYDDTLVESYSYYYYVDKTDEDDLYPELVDLKYPKVGRKNPTAILRVVDLANLVATNTPTFITLEPPEVVSEDHILGGVTWITDTEIATHWLNRRQNYTVLRICNIVTLNCEEEHREQSNGWIPIALPRFSSKGDFFVSTRWSLPQADGNIWQQLYVSIRVNGEIISSSVTPGAFTVNNYIGMDETTLSYYYTRTVTGEPWETQVHVTGAGTGCLSCNLVMPDGGRCAWATATISHGGSYMTITCSSPEEPSATFIYNPRTRQVLYTWEDNAIVRQRLVGRARWESIITTVPLENGFPAPVRLLLPPGLDVNDALTKYPMIYYVYSGPNTNTVFNTFTVGYHSYLTTSRNIIYMLADGRGSGLKGQDILYSLNNALGTVEIEDHFVILKQVLDRYQFIDRSRVGIWGHSYGGYATLLTLLHDDDHLFQCGVSGAPVTSWIYYNTMYTERYMGLPTEEDNLSGYQAGDVNLLAEKLRGHDFYIMHGNADDNVHYQNAAKLMRALQELDIPFEQMVIIFRQVLDRYQFIDRSRVGIWGHSYGGYATLLTLLHDDDHLFQCGVSGAPVTSWIYYNTMYTERYMGLPTEEDNLSGYQAGDVNLLAEKLRGHDFYIMHGNADDNVHYQNAAKLMRALQELDIPFEQMSYPDEAHSLTGVNPHRYNAMDRYWTRCLRLEDWY
uniref:Venom dipeptidyl peptidase 4 n=1 Tax=Heliothis virescens TaxID=7102 RepID=A0A2A4JET8_HELVI